MTSLLLFLLSTTAHAVSLVDVTTLDSSLIVEARYYGTHNFLGRSVAGYRAGKCLLEKRAAEALVKVQSDLKMQGYSLKAYDCYRPAKGVADFVAWSKEEKDQKMKGEFYPRVEKKDAFKLGYIASRSGHSRGSTIDLTLVKLPIVESAAWKEGDKLVDCSSPYGQRYGDNSIDMGTGYDCFDDKAATENTSVGKEAMANRLLLKQAMEKHGFENYAKEWWHYTLKGERYPNTYHDQDVR